MSTIKDIRLYKSNMENTDGNPLPQGFADKKLNAVISRIAMKLRENDFSLGDFDHLYINFTVCSVENGIAPSKRSRDRYHPWYRYYDVEVTQDDFDMLEKPQGEKIILALTEKAVQKYFSSQEFDKEFIHSCFSEAIAQGENMLIKFKEKSTAKNKAVIYLRYLDNGKFFPLLRVFNSEDDLILEKDLPETIDLIAYGEIRLSGKKVTVMPRKNAYSNVSELEPMSFML